MASETAKPALEPRGFGEHTRGLSSEYAHEQGWGLNVDERTIQPASGQHADSGNDFDYGAQDFGDTPIDTSTAKPTPQAVEKILGD